MKMLTVSLLICVLIALAQAAAIIHPPPEHGSWHHALIDPPPRDGHNPSGHDPSGHDPSGHDPSGHDPSGHDPSGHEPSGHEPSGHEPSGHEPSGHDPSGHDPSGHEPSGHDPSGHEPSGHEGPGHTGEDQLHGDTTTIPTTVPQLPGGDYGPDYPFPITQCKSGWKEYSNRCLLYVPEKRTRRGAEDFCKSKEGNLVAALKDWFPEEIDELIKEAGPQSWVGGCSTIDSPWSFSILDWYETPAQPAYIKRTSEGWECVEAEPCKEKLPFICSITRM